MSVPRYSGDSVSRSLHLVGDEVRGLEKFAREGVDIRYDTSGRGNTFKTPCVVNRQLRESALQVDKIFADA